MMSHDHPDSDDEFEESYQEGFTHEPILEPKDHYSFRPLPLRIGTPAFLSEDDIGLRDIPSDSEGRELKVSSVASLSTHQV